MPLGFASIVMKEQELEIDLLHLGFKKYNFNYVLDENYFAKYEQDLLEKGLVNVSAELDKREALVEVKLNYKGVVQLLCDRSLEEFDCLVDFEKIVFLKYGDTIEELDDNLIQLSYDRPLFDIGQIMFELLALEMPSRKIHPRFVDESDEYDNEIFFSTEDIDSEEKEDQKEELDPRWKELLKLKNKSK